VKHPNLKIQARRDGTQKQAPEKLPIARGRRFQVVGVPPSLRCGVGGEKRQRTGAVQDALRGRGDLRPAGQTREILNSIFQNGCDTGNSGNTGFFEHTSLSRRLSNPSRQTREIEAHRHKSRFIVLNRVSESCQFPKQSCIIVINRGKNKESLFSSTRLDVGGYAKRRARRQARPTGKIRTFTGLYVLKKDSFFPVNQVSKTVSHQKPGISK